VGQALITIQSILEQLRADKASNREIGDRFERLMKRYFELDPIYADRFAKVYMWQDWPRRGAFGDTGIDLVAEERATGNCVAIQCKFYEPDHTLAKEHIDSFFTAAGKDAFTSGIIVSTTDKWSRNAEDALKNQSKDFNRISVHDLAASPIDWSLFDQSKPQKLTLREKKKLRDHQKAALKDVAAGLKTADRGKLIMACGTGKTFTALRIAEHLTGKDGGGFVLFLVPSLALLSQSLREWTSESVAGVHPLAVCSDADIGKRKTKANAADDSADILVQDLPFPATTYPQQLINQHKALKKKSGGEGMIVVFSTYQSIEAVSKAQKAGLPDFDLIICDEAHRTTGVTFSGEDESHFVKVHDAKYIKGAKRLYMTATPRIYGDEAKGKARDAEAVLCSMDDEQHFGKELHRLGFGDAVGKQLLADYKVLVLAVDEKYVGKTYQRQLADENNELKLEDAVKITGCWNGLAKKFDPSISTDDEKDQQGTGPMRRAVAFSRSIKDSKAFVARFTDMQKAYREAHPDAAGLLACELDHVDGHDNALRRNALIDWLKAPTPDDTCRILSNARCLSEGVDVPALDAVIFLNPRNSVIDVVQSVGRVMRRAEGKEFGYIILPVGIPADTTPEEALKDNEKYKVVWQVLQALRAHDDRFNATINQIELNRKRPDNIQVIGVSGGEPGERGSSGDSTPMSKVQTQGTFAFAGLDEWKDAIYAKLVLKCGDRRYWETWAADVAKIAESQVSRIKAILEGNDKKHRKAFDEFLAGLHQNINDSISQDDAIEMLAQHLITKPVFDALFADGSFTAKNPVSQSMQRMLDALGDQSLGKDTETLAKFYASVRERAAGIDNPEGRQKVVIELYDNFFRTAFPKMAKRLGIVYTPIEVVDFIIRSVEDVLKSEFNSSLSDKNVHIIDPFTGTGTFMVRLLQSGLIKPEDVLRKYTQELHANEIVLLAYYIAAVNIEEAFRLLRLRDHQTEYVPFDGIVLTDTFQMYEQRKELEEHAFPENNKRVKRQKAAPIMVVIGNPPYSAQQESENDNNANLDYPTLDQRISATYAGRSSAGNTKNLYDSYIRAIRWASDRIGERGVVGFVTNGSFIHANNMDGLRACLSEEFTNLFVFNLRGNQRTSGEVSRAEGGKIFGSGSRTPVAITLMVKNPAVKGKRQIRYCDIGDYLTREEKLATVKGLRSTGGIAKANRWVDLHPNPQHDWINQRDPAFERFVSLGDKRQERELLYFESYTQGLLTSRDPWVYNYSRRTLCSAAKRTLAAFNQQIERFEATDYPAKIKDRLEAIESIIDRDPTKISWSETLKARLARLERAKFRETAISVCVYRPFARQYGYFDPMLVHRESLMRSVFPKAELPNRLICVNSRGSTKEFSALIVDQPPDYECVSKGQCFPLHLYDKIEDEPGKDGTLIDTAEGESVDGYRRTSAITDGILKTFRDAYGPRVSKEDIFYYVYSILHSPEYRTRFASDLKKMLPRIPLTKEAADFKAFTKAGRDLAHWHLNYETIEPYDLTEFAPDLGFDKAKEYRVEKMSYARPDAAAKARGEKWDKTSIIYNSRITLAGIPPEAQEYVVNGKPALEWIMERYQVTVDPDSGIRNDPNDWATEHNQPRYIIDLVKRIVRVSVETVKIVKGLPALKERV
jgi:predicted helicase